MWNRVTVFRDPSVFVPIPEVIDVAGLFFQDFKPCSSQIDIEMKQFVVIEGLDGVLDAPQPKLWREWVWAVLLRKFFGKDVDALVEHVDAPLLHRSVVKGSVPCQCIDSVMFSNPTFNAKIARRPRGKTDDLPLFIEARFCERKKQGEFANLM